MAMKRQPTKGISTSSVSDNSDEQTTLDKLTKSLNKIPSVLQNNSVIELINKTQDEIIKIGTLDTQSKKLLTTYYKEADVENDKQERAIRKSLEMIYEIQNIRHKKFKSLLQSQKSSAFLKLLQVTASRLPLWVPKNNEPPPQLCGAIEALPSYIAKNGDLVAALVKQSGENRWIVAESIAFKCGKYEVEDIDVKESNRNFTLKKKFVKPLPLMRADPVVSPEAFFPCNTFVLAMYPQTTCFFKGLVNAPPKTCHDGYEILFEDDYSKHTNMMSVAQQFVVSVPSSDINCGDDAD